jgi:glycosyltransferase involved in cell wall biosynthesis
MHINNGGPLVVVTLLTYQRTNYALRTLESVLDRMTGPGPIHFYIADDGSPDPQHVDSLLALVPPARLFGYHSERLGPGANWNKAQAQTFGAGVELILWLEDDWVLLEDLDLSPWVELLEVNSAVGLVRLGVLAVGSDLRSVGYAGRFYLEYAPTTQYAYSGNPHLRHARFWHAYGPYPTGFAAGDTEVKYDGRVRPKLAAGGPKIWRPVELGGWAPWGHIGEEPAT